MVDALVGHIEANCQLTLNQLQARLEKDFGVRLSPSTISRKLLDKLYTMKQVCFNTFPFYT